MSIDRETSYRDNFTIIPNEILRCGCLSARAIGIWTYLMSLPKDWKISLKEVCRHFKDGYDSIRAGMMELVEKGYAIKLKSPNVQGRFDFGNWKIFDIKKKFPERELPNVVSPDVVIPELPSTNPLPRTEKQQQPTKSAPVAAVFSCLQEIGIPLADKEWLSSHHSEDDVKHAIAYCKHPKTVIKTSMAQVLKWAAKALPEVPIDESFMIEEHSRIARETEEQVAPCNAYVSAGGASVEVCFLTGMNIPVVVAYSDKNFKQLFYDALKRFGVRKRKVG